MKSKVKPIVIEMSFVVICVAILTFITIKQFGIAKMKSRDVSRKSDINYVSQNLALYYADYKMYPEKSLNELWGKEFADNTGYTYIKLMPRENKENRKSYCYIVSEDRQKYFLLMDIEYKMDGDYRKESYSGCGNNDYYYVTGNLGYKIEDLEALNK